MRSLLPEPHGSWVPDEPTVANHHCPPPFRIDSVPCKYFAHRSNHRRQKCTGISTFKFLPCPARQHIGVLLNRNGVADFFLIYSHRDGELHDERISIAICCTQSAGFKNTTSFYRSLPFHCEIRARRRSI